MEARTTFPSGTNFDEMSNGIQGPGSKEISENSEHDSMGGFDRCNLIINYLPHEIDDGILKVLFSQHGDIVMAKVIKDKATKRSLGFAFVKYASEAAAAEAISKKNGMVLGRKQLKVSYARPSSDEIKNCKLYVTNLPRDFSEREVLALFQQFGDVIECRVLKQANSPGYKGVAFIQYDLHTQAENALSMNGYIIPNNNRPISVKFAENQHKKKERRMPQNFPGRIGGMYGMPGAGRDERGINVEAPNSFYFQQAQLSPLYASALSASLPMVTSPVNSSMYYGNPISSYSSMKSDSAMPEAWYGQMAPVTYLATQQQALQYANASSGVQYEGVPVDPMAAQTQGGAFNAKGRDSGSVTLMISNLPSYADLNYIHKLFSGYGRILSAQIEVNNPSNGDKRSGVCAGRGKVQLASMAEANLAINALHGVVVDNLPLQVNLIY